MVKAALLALVACGARPPAVPANQAASDDVTLYRDIALVRQRVPVEASGREATIELKIAAGTTADRVVIADRDGLTIRGLRVASWDTRDEVTASVLALDIAAPHPGHYSIAITYATDRLRWDAAYTMTTTPAREQAILHGALAIRNTSGLVLHDVLARVVDAELNSSRERGAGKLATDLVGGTPDSRPAAPAREIGRIEIGDGETRVELVPEATARAMRSVLVYDPIGTKLDVSSTAPARDAALGVRPPAPSHVTESFEVERDEHGSSGLPAGPVRLLERHGDGSLIVLGESRLFDAATRVAAVDTIAVGTADGITGHRERRELTIDDDNRRLVEEFVITIDNQRPQPAHVVIREHMYRGLNWHLPYPLPPVAEQEGPQQIALRAVVPAHAQAKQLYVVVYTWDR
jgi:hypothetical protein